MLDLVGTPGAATIEQSFPTVPGQDYVFSGWIAHNVDNPVAQEGRANVYLNGQFFGQLFHRHPLATHTDMGWILFSHRFRAVASITTLTLEDVTNTWDAGGGLFLDGLSVTPAAAQDDLTSGPARLFVSAIDGTPTRADQVEINVGQCLTLTYVIRTTSGGPTGTGDVLDVTLSPNTSLFTDPPRGVFRERNIFCATEGERNRIITVYARYRDPSTGQTITDGVIVKVRR